MANSTIKNPNAVISDSVAGARCYKMGRVVYLIFDKNSVTADADETIATIPEGFRPIYSITVLDSLNKIRLSIASTGNIKAAEPISNKNIRGGVTYICE